VPLLAPSFTDQALRPVGDWHPARYTPSLTGTEEFCTEGDRLLAFLAVHWRSPEAERFLLDPWQVWLIRHVLETYPDDWPVVELRGQLRFRQVVVSVARQNGKSVIGAVLNFYYLTMHVRGPRVVGVASVERQAKIVYQRVKYVVENNDLIGRELRATETRGITRRDGTGIYQTLPNDEESAQGEPITGCVYDELHLGNAGLWDALVLGQRARRNSQLTGITTAGDDDSRLLARLYADGERAIDGEDERFGFFVWEAADDELTEANVIAASPAIACGRIDLNTAMSDAVKLDRAGPDESGVVGRDRRIRYISNRFVSGSATSWASLAAYAEGTRHDFDELEHGATPTYGLDITAGRTWAAVVESRNHLGILHSSPVAYLPDPDHDRLVEVCKRLARRGPCRFAMDRAVLADVAETLGDLGYEVVALTAGQMQSAAATTAAAIGRRHLRHPDDPTLKRQMVDAKRRNTPEGWRVSRTLSTGDVDAVMALLTSAYVASTTVELGLQIG
jgi:phage terminase large subunit-like protein